MEFNAELWEERFASLRTRMDDIAILVTDIRTALFGNGKKDNSIDSKVRAHDKFVKEWEAAMHDIQRDILKKMVWAVLALAVLMLGGMGGIMAVMVNTMKALVR